MILPAIDGNMANITNGPSVTEVQVFEEPFSHRPALNLASDARLRPARPIKTSE
jgi:hypothetical protein